MGAYSDLLRLVRGEEGGRPQYDSRARPPSRVQSGRTSIASLMEKALQAEREIDELAKSVEALPPVPRVSRAERHAIARHAIAQKLQEVDDRGTAMFKAGEISPFEFAMLGTKLNAERARWGV